MESADGELPDDESPLIVDRAAGVQTGTIEDYREDRGFGFIGRHPGPLGGSPPPSLWFHISTCKCSRPYKGETVLYEMGIGKDGGDIAQGVRRLPTQNATGDVVEWNFDASAREGRGVIAPNARRPPNTLYASRYRPGVRAGRVEEGASPVARSVLQGNCYRWRAKSRGCRDRLALSPSEVRLAGR